MLASTVSAIPCLVDVTHCHVVPGSYSYHAASDVDYYGYVDVQFTVCDRRGRPAPWLQRKMTPADADRIEGEILDAYHRLRRDAEPY
jgi:hypothetical protein